MLAFCLLIFRFRNYVYDLRHHLPPIAITIREHSSVNRLQQEQRCKHAVPSSGGRAVQASAARVRQATRPSTMVQEGQQGRKNFLFCGYTCTYLRVHARRLRFSALHPNFTAKLVAACLGRQAEAFNFGQLDRSYRKKIRGNYGRRHVAAILPIIAQRLCIARQHIHLLRAWL